MHRLIHGDRGMRTRKGCHHLVIACMPLKKRPSGFAWLSTLWFRSQRLYNPSMGGKIGETREKCKSLWQKCSPRLLFVQVLQCVHDGHAAGKEIKISNARNSMNWGTLVQDDTKNCACPSHLQTIYKETIVIVVISCITAEKSRDFARLLR